MGSNLKSKDLPEIIKKSLLKMFGELKYTVLWKFEEVLPDLPKNVHILKWAPQQSILGTCAFKKITVLILKVSLTLPNYVRQGPLCSSSTMLKNVS